MKNGANDCLCVSFISQMRHLVATLGVKDALPKDFFDKALAVDEFHAVVEDKVRLLEATLHVIVNALTKVEITPPNKKLARSNR